MGLIAATKPFVNFAVEFVHGIIRPRYDFAPLVLLVANCERGVQLAASVALLQEK
jgi:hypothetical protein